MLCSRGAVDRSVDWRTLCGAVMRVTSSADGPCGLGECVPLPQAPPPAPPPRPRAVPGDGGYSDGLSTLRPGAAVTGRIVAEDERDVSLEGKVKFKLVQPIDGGKASSLGSGELRPDVPYNNGRFAPIFQRPDDTGQRDGVLLLLLPFRAVRVQLHRTLEQPFEAVPRDDGISHGTMAAVSGPVDFPPSAYTSDWSRWVMVTGSSTRLNGSGTKHLQETENNRGCGLEIPATKTPDTSPGETFHRSHAQVRANAARVDRNAPNAHGTLLQHADLVPVERLHRVSIAAVPYQRLALQVVLQDHVRVERLTVTVESRGNQRRLAAIERTIARTGATGGGGRQRAPGRRQPATLERSDAILAQADGSRAYGDGCRLLPLSPVLSAFSSSLIVPGITSAWVDSSLRKTKEKESSGFIGTSRRRTQYRTHFFSSVMCFRLPRANRNSPTQSTNSSRAATQDTTNRLGFWPINAITLPLPFCVEGMSAPAEPFERLFVPRPSSSIDNRSSSRKWVVLCIRIRTFRRPLEYASLSWLRLTTVRFGPGPPSTIPSTCSELKRLPEGEQELDTEAIC
uniref:Uncharacterized protein n=1 Tax=Anopheles atroparvus TaxID=41427 RepID=A0A182J4X3_ANOAO